MSGYSKHSWRKKAREALSIQEKSNQTVTYSSLLSPQDSFDSEYTKYQEEASSGSRHSKSNCRKHLHTITMIILATLVIVQSIFLLRAFQVAGRAWPVPDFKTDTITFGRRIEWEFSPQAEDLWNGAVSGSGLVAIKNPEQYGLVNGLNTSVASSRVYGITVTHEYHCLQLIHKSLIGIATRNATYMEEIHATNTSVELPNGKLNHLFHCVDYLRQNIMCKADTTLEWNTVADSEHIDGYGIPHQCRNWQEVSGWMRENLPPEKEYQEMQQID